MADLAFACRATVADCTAPARTRAPREGDASPAANDARSDRRESDYARSHVEARAKMTLHPPLYFRLMVVGVTREFLLWTRRARGCYYW